MKRGTYVEHRHTKQLGVVGHHTPRVESFAYIYWLTAWDNATERSHFYVEYTDLNSVTLLIIDIPLSLQTLKRQVCG